MKLWHVTHKDNLASILADGFEAGWGDNGFGVYFFNDLSAASDYAYTGGWDGELSIDDAVLIEAECDDNDPFPVEIQPDWPNPEDYDAVYVVFREEDDPFFKPVSSSVIEIEHQPKP